MNRTILIFFAFAGCCLGMDPPAPCDYPTEPPAADWNQDGGVDGADVEAFCADWTDGLADVNTDGGCDDCDWLYFLEAWERGD
jgi:hypothetical protein